MKLDGLLLHNIKFILLTYIFWKYFKDFCMNSTFQIQSYVFFPHIPRSVFAYPHLRTTSLDTAAVAEKLKKKKKKSQQDQLWGSIWPLCVPIVGLTFVLLLLPQTQGSHHASKSQFDNSVELYFSALMFFPTFNCLHGTTADKNHQRKGRPPPCFTVCFYPCVWFGVHQDPEQCNLIPIVDSDNRDPRIFVSSF